MIIEKGTMKTKYQGIEIHKEEPSYITEFSRTLLGGETP